MWQIRSRERSFCVGILIHHLMYQHTTKKGSFLDLIFATYFDPPPPLSFVWTTNDLNQVDVPGKLLIE